MEVNKTKLKNVKYKIIYILYLSFICSILWTKCYYIDAFASAPERIVNISITANWFAIDSTPLSPFCQTFSCPGTLWLFKLSGLCKIDESSLRSSCFLFILPEQRTCPAAVSARSVFAFSCCQSAPTPSNHFSQRVAICNLPLATSVFAPMTNAQMKNQTVRPVRSCRISTICECKTVRTFPCAVSSGFILLIYGCILRFVRYYVDLLALSPRLACHNINNKAICQLRMLNFACVATNRSSLLSSLIFNEFTPSNSCA